MGQYNQAVSSTKAMDTQSSTILKYNLPQDATVQMEVISGFGRIAFVVLDELQPKGDYTINNQQSHLRSGIYLLRTKVTTDTTTINYLKRIVLKQSTALKIEKKVDNYYKITIS